MAELNIRLPKERGSGLGVLCLGHLIPATGGALNMDPATPTTHSLVWPDKADMNTKELIQGIQTPVGQIHLMPEDLMTGLWGKLYQGAESHKAAEIKQSTMLPIRPPPGLSLPVASAPAYIFQEAEDSVPPPPIVPPEFARVKDLPSSQVSLGSAGHPTACADACQYLRRKGGCREGTDCSKCHLCFWQRKSRQGGDETSQEDAAPVGLTFSIGTQGHPDHCGNACKYVRRKTGCLNGESCPQCHLCQWRRDLQPKGSFVGASTPETIWISLAVPMSLTTADVHSSGLVAGGDVLGQASAQNGAFCQWNSLIHPEMHFTGKVLSIFV